MQHPYDLQVLLGVLKMIEAPLVLVELDPDPPHGLSARVARSVLAHEIGHHCLGHRPTRRAAARARQERSANEWAASRLIPPAAYAEAELVREGHVGGIAFDLNVSDELVVVYRSLLLRTEISTYVDPRLGVGQWGHRIECSDA